jgi:hypothetical protein
LAAAAGKVGGKIAVLCAVESAIESTQQLFAEHVRDAATSVNVIQLARVWELFRRGDMDECLAAIAASADEAYEAGATVVALGHPWMTPAANLAREGRRPLDSAHTALRTVMERIGGSSIAI